MFTAVQAKNIAKERSNHRYYKLYAKYSRKIMRQITKAVNHGKGTMTWRADNDSKLTMAVLHQIAKELEMYGYSTSVYASKPSAKAGENVVGVITVSWAK